MTPEEKQEQIFASWLSGRGIPFVSPEAEEAYKERVNRLKAAIQLQKMPDRVPVCPVTGFFPAYYGGMTVEEAMYDYDRAAAAWKKYVLDFAPDAYIVPPEKLRAKRFSISENRLDF